MPQITIEYMIMIPILILQIFLFPLTAGWIMDSWESSRQSLALKETLSHLSSSIQQIYSALTHSSMASSTITIDPNGDDISYGWDWDGDGVVDEWTEFKSSGSPVSTLHMWTSGFTGEIKVRGKDTNDEEGPWSDQLSVSMSKNKNEKTMNTPFSRFLQNFLNSHYNLFSLLRQFLLRI